jgi:hypothetical protein
MMGLFLFLIFIGKVANQFFCFYFSIAIYQPVNLTYDGEFFQEEGLEGSFEIVLDVDLAMEVDNDTIIVDGDDGEEVHNAKDLLLLEQHHSGSVASDETLRDDHNYVDNSDDEIFGPPIDDLDDYF